mmetsp:Transcript_18550/g.43538  ORF Transcript_18550/g.43538 Transcript_18550/m.43538 type:complete len:204 (+) Transcript_18550:1278-1889(+)
MARKRRWRRGAGPALHWPGYGTRSRRREFRRKRTSRPRRPRFRFGSCQQPAPRSRTIGVNKPQSSCQPRSCCPSSTRSATTSIRRSTSQPCKRRSFGSVVPSWRPKTRNLSRGRYSLRLGSRRWLIAKSFLPTLWQRVTDSSCRRRSRTWSCSRRRQSSTSRTLSCDRHERRSKLGWHTRRRWRENCSPSLPSKISSDNAALS